MSDHRVTVEAPAKVNLYLAVGQKRGDGYHDVTTVLQTIEFGDRVTLEHSDVLELVSDTDLGIPAEENLAYRAAVVLADACGQVPRVRITLEKRVPAGAGLAGGSSDAAAVLAGLASMWGVDPWDQRIHATAETLGTDVPFFLGGGTALYTGRGERLDRRVPSLPLDIALVWPGSPVETRMAYEAFDARPLAAAPGPEAMISACASGDPSRVARALYNNMTDASTGLVSGIAEAIAWCIRSEGVLGAAMAGSGSGVFAICESGAAARRVVAEASVHGWWSRATRTTERGVELRVEEAS